MTTLPMPKKPEPQLTKVHPMNNGVVDYGRGLIIPITAWDIFTGTDKWDELNEEFGPRQEEFRAKRMKQQPQLADA